jgi:hypothetical protein
MISITSRSHKGESGGDAAATLSTRHRSEILEGHLQLLLHLMSTISRLRDFHWRLRQPAKNKKEEIFNNSLMVEELLTTQPGSWKSFILRRNSIESILALVEAEAPVDEYVKDYYRTPSTAVRDNECRDFFGARIST